MKLSALWTAPVIAAVFEAMALVVTQDKAVRATSPWQDDPYNVVVSFALFAVPMLALALLVRRPAWRAPGGADRVRQAARAAGALLAVIGATLATAWAAVIARGSGPAALLGGLVVLSVLVAADAAGLWWQRAPRGAARGWRHDWLGDVPLLGRWFPGLADRVRAHATAVFAGLSLLAAAGIVGAQAVGERWTDPVLIGWALLVETALNFAFCVVANAVAGFIARPARSRAARVTESAVLAGAAGLVAMTAFRDPLWTAVAGAPVAAVPTLVALTVGTGLTVAAATAAVQLWRTAA
ncbi:hypothetical protein [Dactylosporangium sp. NPDC051541]|uniref:hypothetical protein n=1 Tax=Dactylosporangium sp. NPDC051541 TaxID=3363977 RepID=UPI0037A66A2D